MSKGFENLEENQVTANAKAADPQGKLENEGSGLGSVEDLGGPTPQNSKPDDESNKLRTPSKGQIQSPKNKPSSASADKQETIQKKPTFEESEVEGETLEEEIEDEVEMIEIDLSADVAALTEGEDLTEEFKEKAKTIFEAAVISRLNEELEHIHEQYAEVLEEEIETVKQELAEQVDDYLSYAVSQWIENNALAIEHGVKSEMAESVLEGLKQVFVENYISIPDEKADLVDEMVDQLDVMEDKLNEQIAENVELHKALGGFIKNGIVAEISEGLSLSQKEKLSSLAEAVEFETEESFYEKVKTLKESYFSSKPQVGGEVISEETQAQNAPVSDSMSRYVTALSRWK